MRDGYRPEQFAGDQGAPVEQQPGTCCSALVSVTVGDAAASENGDVEMQDATVKSACHARVWFLTCLLSFWFASLPFDYG